MSKLLVIVSVVALANSAMAEDSCHILSAGEGQKVACAQAKLDGKISELRQRLMTLSHNVAQEVREATGRMDDNDAAERAGRMEALKSAVSAVKSEVSNLKNAVRTAVGRSDDNDSVERKARLEKAEKALQDLEQYAGQLEDSLEQFFKNMFGVVTGHATITPTPTFNDQTGN